MFLNDHRLRLLSVVFWGLLIWGCSSGTGGDSLTAGGGIGGSGVTVGSVSKFGSVFVNDVEFDTVNVVVIVDGVEKGIGDQAVLDSLAVGKVVRIEGMSCNNGTGTADRIVYNENIIGPVDSVMDVDANTREITVMGQTVIADAQTQLSQTTLAAIVVGNMVEVSGFVDERGFILAGYLKKTGEIYSSGDEVQVLGNAYDINELTQTFKINSLLIDYSAADTNQLVNGAPQLGQLLEVKGILSSSGILIATLVKPEDVFGVANANEVEISGIVTLFGSLNDFKIGGVSVKADSITEYMDILPEDIGAGSKLTVKGPLTNGILLADTIRSAAQTKIESNVASVGSDSLLLDGFSDLTIHINGLTRILGAADNPGQINAGDHVKIFGTSFSSGNSTASKIIVKKQTQDTVALRGPVESIDGGVITVLGVAIDTVDTDSVNRNGFSIENGEALSQNEFQSRVSIGDTVNAMGNLIEQTGGVYWQSIEINDND